jgi:hypothetical protein
VLVSVICLQVLYSNVAHPKLAAFIKKNSWLVQSGEYLTFPQNQSEFKGGVQHYLDSIEEVRFFFSCLQLSSTSTHVSSNATSQLISIMDLVLIDGA